MGGASQDSRLLRPHHRRELSLSATMASGQNEMLSKAEDIADKVTRSSKHVLPHLARFCLVSTFFEDGIRMWVQWSEQRECMDISWGCGWFLATLFVVTNLIGQLGAVAMVLTRFKVDIACGILFMFLTLLRRSSRTWLALSSWCSSPSATRPSSPPWSLSPGLTSSTSISTPGGTFLHTSP